MKLSVGLLLHIRLASRFFLPRYNATTSNGKKTYWDAEKVDAENFKKHGITAAIG
jgi:hypothetical protein